MRQKATACEQPPASWPTNLIDEHAASKLIGVPVDTLRYWRCVRTVGVPFIKIGKSVRYEPSALWAFLNKNTVQPAVVRLIQ